MRSPIPRPYLGACEPRALEYSSRFYFPDSSERGVSSFWEFEGRGCRHVLLLSSDYKDISAGFSVYGGGCIQRLEPNPA